MGVNYVRDSLVCRPDKTDIDPDKLKKAAAIINDNFFIAMIEGGASHLPDLCVGKAPPSEGEPPREA